MRQCAQCDGSLERRRKDARYCSAACRAAASRARAAEPVRDFWAGLRLIRRRRSAQRRTSDPESCHREVAGQQEANIT